MSLKEETIREDDREHHGGMYQNRFNMAGWDYWDLWRSFTLLSATNKDLLINSNKQYAINLEDQDFFGVLLTFE